MKLSIVIPAHNEEDCLYSTVLDIVNILLRECISHEIIIINDNSTDSTALVCERLCQERTTVRFINNQSPNGFGFAIRRGLQEFTGDAVAIMMADASDDPQDLATAYIMLQEGYDCIFGSRFIQNGCVFDYPKHKLFINRLANRFIQLIFGLRYNDTTNAFKLYRREVIEGIQPILSHHFNLTVELPLKAIIRGFSYKIIPIKWYDRTTGVSKLKIKEMGSRYLFIVLYVWLEKYLSRGDYHRNKMNSQLQHSTRKGKKVSV